MNGSKKLGSISSYSSHIISPQYEFSNKENLLAHRLSFQNKGDSLKRTFKITHLILPNGKISVYYDKMTQEIGLPFQSRLSGSLACDGGERKLYTSVFKKWMKSGTLVEYEVSGDCPKHKTAEKCQDFKTPNRKCMWYEEASICIVSTDKDIDDSKNSSNVNVSTTPIVVEQATTTPGISESELRNELGRTDEQSESHLNMTTVTTGDNGHRKSHNSLHIILPSVTAFLVVCSGCVICLWLYRKKKCMPSLS
uniref:Uncharacterized protein n=1 Tax=Schistosoma mansoni TaxID=6183 RepID=A0AA82N8F0_SCHMA